MAEPLLVITAWSLRPIDITKLLHSSFVMLFQALTTASLSSCLIRGVSPLSLLFRRWNACTIGLRSGYWLGQSKTFHFFPLIKSFVLLAVCFGSLSCCMINSSLLVWMHFSINWQTKCFCTPWNSFCYYHHLWHHQKILMSLFQKRPCTPKPWQMNLYVLDHKQFLYFSTLWPFHHFGVISP